MDKETLIALVAAVVGQHMVTHAVSEHALHASGHPHADITSELSRRWTCLGTEDAPGKQALLSSQQAIYTAINASPTHKPWRTATASRLTTSLLSSLSGLLAPTSSPQATSERNHILTELYVKGFRIGFRLRMEAVKWDCVWPRPGTVFDPATMVNENRMLYGDVLRTVQGVMGQPGIHEVRFAMSPTITRAEYGGVGGGKEVVVHNAIVHVARKGWA
jgi:hypothetical protein